jgi:ferritin-like metal-binding protein YciE
MAEKNTLHDAFLDELRDMYHAEKQLTSALPKLAKKAKSPDLTEAFRSHLAETENHVTRLEQVFAELGETAKAKTCDGMKGIIAEANEMIGESYDDETMDAVLIASAQRAEHYEIAAYGTLVTWARTMEHDSAADLLQQNLDEEKAADEKLTDIAESGINEQAAQSTH